MDAILEGMATPKNFFSAAIGTGTGFFNYKSTSGEIFQTEKKLLFSPTLSYIHKSGFGITTTAYAVSQKDGINAYQFSATPSYDYSERRIFSTGAAFTKYFTKKDLAFYTTPIRNEAYGYFNLKRYRVQPGIAVAYGWGSRTEYTHRALDIERLRRIRDSRLIRIRTDESIRDLSLLLSVKHEFNWFNVFADKDLFTLTPVLLLSSGTQNFGFNTSFHSRSKTVNNFLPGNQYITGKTSFDTQSATAIVRADYSVGRFFIQTQVLFDYYLHTADNRFNNALAIVGGIIL